MKTHKDYPLLVMDDRGKRHLDAVLSFAERCSESIRTNLHKDLARLEDWSEGTTRCLLYPDFGVFGAMQHATPDFGFVLYSTKDQRPYEHPPLEWPKFFNGGLIYHGSHDGYGAGGAPNFSVTLTPTAGWSIHT